MTDGLDLDGFEGEHSFGEEAPSLYGAVLEAITPNPETKAAERAAFNRSVAQVIDGTPDEPYAGEDQGALTEIARRLARAADTSWLLDQMKDANARLTASFAPAEEPVPEPETWAASIPSGVLMALADVSLGRRSTDHEPAGINREAWRSLLRDQGLLR